MRNKSGKWVIYAVGCLYLALLPQVLEAQKKPLSTSEIDQKFSEIWRQSEVSREHYAWKEQTEVTRDGEIVQVLVENVSVGPSGREIRQVISNREASLPGTFLIRQIAEEQKSKIVSFMSGLRTFLEQYALTNDSIRQAFFSRAQISAPDSRGLVLVSGSGVFAKGDRLKWWIDTRSYTITYATISTSFQGVAADFSATYYMLPGMNYMSQATIRVPSKNMKISLKFYDFVKR